MRIEQATAAQRDRHRFDVAWAHRIAKRTVIRLWIASRIRLKVHAITVLKIAAQRQLAGERGRSNTWDTAYRFQSLLEEPVSRLLVESVPRSLYLHREQVRRLESGNNREQA